MALFLCAWCAGLYKFLFIGGYGFGRGYGMAAIARSPAGHGTYANPFAPAITGPTALVPPVHPLFLAALMRIFHTPAAMETAIFANILANAYYAVVSCDRYPILWTSLLPAGYAGDYFGLPTSLAPSAPPAILRHVTTTNIATSRRRIIFPGSVCIMWVIYCILAGS